MSPPARGRGLKPHEKPRLNYKSMVAPRAGAWIETCMRRKGRLRRYVAPRAGAWIETGQIQGQPLEILVAPRAGAWIETWESGPCLIAPLPSPPARGRGLKP